MNKFKDIQIDYENFKTHMINEVNEIIESNDFEKIQNFLRYSKTGRSGLYYVINESWEAYKRNNNLSFKKYELAEDIIHELIRAIIPMIIPGIDTVITDYLIANKLFDTKQHIENVTVKTKYKDNNISNVCIEGKIIPKNNNTNIKMNKKTT